MLTLFKFQISAVTFFLGFLCAAFAIAATPPILLPAAPTVSAKSHVVMDFQSGQFFAEKNADERVEPASLTKIMTAYVIEKEMTKMQTLRDQLTVVSEKAWRSEGSRMFVEVNERVKVDDLIKGIVIASGNDASIAMAEFIAGSEEAFADLMNQYAHQLGMHNSHFTNSTGLPDPNLYTTARDLAILAKALIQEFPEHYKLYAEKSFIYDGIKQHNRNLLLWRDETVDGMKTGHTQTAGYCMVVSALRDGMRLIAVVMGSRLPTIRAEDSQKLLGYGFRFYETHQLYAAWQPLTESRAWMGKQKKLLLGVGEDLYVTIPRGRYNELNAAMNVSPTIQAPAQKGDHFGTVSVTLDNKVVLERPLVATHDLVKGHWLRRLFDWVTRFFVQLFS
ncbi:MAG: D-alanyl-D-alanine carboxypeptidase [Gammaproteobacteria bacterium]|nr:D-alanyl-D-alanine carboxypeptidase [Gammaproteobacteria bacterium]